MLAEFNTSRIRQYTVTSNSRFAEGVVSSRYVVTSIVYKALPPRALGFSAAIECKLLRRRCFASLHSERYGTFDEERGNNDDDDAAAR